MSEEAGFQEVLAENEKLRAQLQEAVETLDAIRHGEVDALVVSTPKGEQVYTLRSAEQPYRILVENMQEGAVTLLRDGTILYCNARFAEITQKPLEEIIGSCVHELFDSGDREAVRALFSEEAGRGEFQLVTGTGAVPVLISVSTAVIDDITSVCLVVTDLSEQKRNEAAVMAEKQAKNAAQEANAAKDQFLAVLSHELRTPLTPVLMTASALESDPDLPETLREDMGMIKRSIELEVSLINDLLDVNRIARGKLELHLQQLDAHVIFEAAFAVCRSEAQTRGLVLSCELAAREHQVQADGSRLQQVFWNLLKNAVKFTPRGGRIEVRSFNPRPGVFCVEVADTGIGIEPEAMPRLFDAFEQGSLEMTRQFGGLGLGLAICKSLVDMHGGSIRAESPGPGQGARFIVELPTIPSIAEEHPRSGFGEPGAGRSLRILIVEDHDMSAQIISRLLERAGNVVKTAGSVHEGLKLVNAETFDLLISDLGLPDGSGLDLMRQIRARHPDLRAIALSGYGMERDIQRSKDAGFAEHLTKPIEFDALKAAVERIAANR